MKSYREDVCFSPWDCGFGTSLLLTVSAGYLYIKPFLFVSKSPVRCKLCFRLSSSTRNPSLLRDWTKNAKKTQLQNSTSIFMLSRWLICYTIMIHPAVSMSSLKLKHLLFRAQSFIILHSASGDVFCVTSIWPEKKQRKQGFNREQRYLPCDRERHQQWTAKKQLKWQYYAHFQANSFILGLR